MADNSGIKQHVSIDERNRWNKVVVDFGNHLGSNGVGNHALGNGTTAGFSTNDYTNAEKTKLAGVQEGALNNPHPASHPWTMITGLKQLANTASYNHLVDVPLTFIAGGGNSDTVNNIRVSIQTTAPTNPINDRELWVDLTSLSIKFYHNNTWIITRAAWA